MPLFAIVRDSNENVEEFRRGPDAPQTISGFVGECEPCYSGVAFTAVDVNVSNGWDDTARKPIPKNASGMKWGYNASGPSSGLMVEVSKT